MSRHPLPIAILLAAAALVGCPSSQPQAKRLVYGRGGDSVELDPADVSDGESVKVAEQIFENLVAYTDGGSEIVPELAESWETSADGLDWTFHLRSGVTFHDGSPFDADSVVFTFQRFIDPNHPYRFDTGGFPYAPNYHCIERVEAVDAHTVRFHLRTSSAVFLANLAMFPAGIVSKHALEERGEGFAQNPSGTGPFRFVSWRRNDRIVLTVNEGYWRERPGVDEVVFAVVPENAARLERLARGELHIIDGINLSDIERIQGDSSLRLLSTPGMNFGYLSMNNEEPPFDDVNVRRAVAHAIDKRKLVDLVFYGRAQPAVNPMPPTIWGYNQDIVDYPHDPARARELLGGRTIQTTLHAMPNPRPYMPEPLAVAQAIKEDLRAVGIDVEIVSPSWDAYLADVANGHHRMALLGWTTDNGDPDNFLHELLDPDTAVRGSANNISFYRSDAVHALLIEAQRNTDHAERERLYRRAQEIIHDDCPMIPLVYLDNLAASRAEVTGYQLHPMGLVRLRACRLSE